MSTPAKSDSNAVLNDLAQTLRRSTEGVPDDIPFRISRVYQPDGSPDTVSQARPRLHLRHNDEAGEDEYGTPLITREVPFLGNLKDYQPGDAVVWINWNGSPLVIGRFPITGTEWSVDEGGDPWHYIGATGEPTFNAGWGPHADTQYAAPRFRKQSDGWVHLSGLAVGGTGTMFTLPYTHSPVTQLEFTVMSGNTTAAVIRVDQFGIVSLQVGSAATFVSLDGITFPTLPAKTGWLSPTLENDWVRQDVSSTLAEPYEIVEFFQRSDGWHWMKGRVSNGPASGSHDFARLPPGTTLNGFAQMLGGFVSTTAAARFDFGGADPSGNRRDNVVIYSNWAGAAGSGDVRLTGNNWFGQQGYNNRWVWISTFANNWAAFDADWSRVRHYRDVHGVMHLRGHLQANAATADTILAAGALSGENLPDKRVILRAVSGGGTHQRVDVLTDGSVIATARPATSLSFTGLHYVTAVDA